MKAFLIQVGPNSTTFPTRVPPMGLMLLSAYVEREVPGASVEILDMKVSNLQPEDVGGMLREKQPDVVGLSAFSVHGEWFHRTAASVRAALPEVLLVAGGPHATCFPDEVIADRHIDAIVLGEGEKAFTNLLSAHGKGGRLDGILAVGSRSSLDPQARDIVEDLDTLPFPAWRKADLPAYERYFSMTLVGKRRYMLLATSRACPYDCIYCHNMHGKRFRARSPASVLEEIRTLVSDYGINDFEVIDDIFNLDRDRVVGICESILKENLKVRLGFGGSVRADLLDDELLGLMRRAGTAYIAFSIETATPRLQKLIRKNLDLDRATRAMRTARRLGIFCTGAFMVGFPSETDEELRRTLDFAVRSPLQGMHLLKVTPYGGTALYATLDEATKKAICQNPERSFDFQIFPYNLSQVPNEQLRSMVRRTFYRFYLRPTRIFYFLRNHPSPWSLLQFARFILQRLLVPQ